MADSNFVVFNPNTLYVAKNKSQKELKYVTRASATRSFNNMSPEKQAKLIIGTIDEYNALDVEVEVKSMMSDKMVKIPKSLVGTCCDPSTERYWSM